MCAAAAAGGLALPPVAHPAQSKALSRKRSREGGSKTVNGRLLEILGAISERLQNTEPARLAGEAVVGDRLPETAGDPESRLLDAPAGESAAFDDEAQPAALPSPSQEPLEVTDEESPANAPKSPVRRPNKKRKSVPVSRRSGQEAVPDARRRSRKRRTEG